MISIKKYNHKMQYVWDHFIINSNNGGTIFQTQKFLSYHITRTFNDCSLMFYKKNQLVCVLPASYVDNKKTLVSHPGASFGGFVIKKPSYELCKNIILSFEKYCIKNGILNFIFTLTPRCYYGFYNEVFEYLLVLSKYNVVERYISHIIKFNKKQSPLDYLNKRKQRYIKNLFFNSNEFVIKSSVDVEAFYPVLIENKKRFNCEPTHSLGEIKKLFKLFPESIKMYLTFKKKRVVGGVLLFITSSNSCLLFYNVILNEHRGKQISLFQIYNIIKECLGLGVSFVDLGVSHLPNNKNPLLPKKNLIKFKEQFSCKGVIRKVYNKKFI